MCAPPDMFIAVALPIVIAGMGFVAFTPAMGCDMFMPAMERGDESTSCAGADSSACAIACAALAL
jgi:hypothetical protein